MMTGLFRYAYVQSKSRAMKSRLLGPDDWHYLLRMRSLDDVFRYLGATDYGAFFPNPPAARYDTVSVSLGLHDSLFTDYRKLIRSLPRVGSPVLYALLARFEAENIKTLLRGIWQSSPEPAIRRLLYRMGSLSRLPVTAVLEARRIPAAVDLFKKTVFHSPLVHALTLFKTQETLFPLEMAVDSAAFRLLADQIKRLGGTDRNQAARLSGIWVDGVNLSWLVRFRWIFGLSPEEVINYSLPGGRHLTLHDIGNLARASDPLSFVTSLPPPYRDALKGIQHWHEVHPFFQTWLVTELYRVFTKDPFHIGLPISYLLLKEIEVKALEGLISAMGTGESDEGHSRFWRACWMRDAWNNRRIAA